MKREQFHILVWSCSCVLDMSGHCVTAPLLRLPHSAAGEWGSHGHSAVSAGALPVDVVVYSPGVIVPLLPWGRHEPVSELRPGVVTLPGHVPWTLGWGNVLCCVCPAGLASCPPWVPEELGGSCTEQIPSGHSAGCRAGPEPAAVCLGELLEWKGSPSTRGMPHERVLQAGAELSATAAGEEHLPGVSTSAMSRSWRLDSV